MLLSSPCMMLQSNLTIQVLAVDQDPERPGVAQVGEVVEQPRRLVVRQAGAEIRRLMEGAAELAVPLVVDIGVGDNWDQAH